MPTAISYSAYALWDNAQVYAAADHVQAGLLPFKPKAGEENDATFEELRAINPDVAAWVTMDNTGIDYPVLQGEENLNYLNTDVYGDFALAGSIFLDTDCSRDFTDPYSLLYGHHMENGKMFGDVDLYQDAAFFAQNTTGELVTPDRTYRLETVAIRDGETGAFGPIEYTAPGYYTYQITQQAGGSSRGRYDKTVFYVRVTVAWEGAALKAAAAVHTTPERSDPKRDEVRFVNRYDPIPVPDPDPGPTPTPAPTPAPDPTPTPPDPTAPEPMAPVDDRPADAPKVQNPVDASSPAADARPTLVQTGQLNWPVPVLAGSGTVLLAVGLYRVSRSRRRDDRAE